MGEFFKGWRRKAGLVTLVVAMLLTVGMLRSFVIQDEYWTILAGDMYGTDSANGELAVLRETASAYDMRGDWYIHCAYRHAGKPQANFTAPSYREESSQFCAGFTFKCFVHQTGELNRLGQPRTFHVIRGSYWKLILALTLIAAALILPERWQVIREALVASNSSSRDGVADPHQASEGEGGAVDFNSRVGQDRESHGHE